MTYWSCLLYCSHFGYAINICICTCWLCNYLLISNMLTMRQGARTSGTCLLNIPHRRSRAVLCVFMTDNYFFNQGKPAGYWQNPKTGRYQEPLFSQFSSGTAPVSKHHFIWSICTMYFHLCCYCNNMDCWRNSLCSVYPCRLTTHCRLQTTERSGFPYLQKMTCTTCRSEQRVTTA